MSLFATVIHSLGFRWVLFSLTQRGKSLPCPAEPNRSGHKPVQNWPAVARKSYWWMWGGFACTQKETSTLWQNEYLCLLIKFSVNSHPPTRPHTPTAMQIQAVLRPAKSNCPMELSGWNKTHHNRADSHTGHMTNCPRYKGRYRGRWRRKHRMSKRFTIYSRHDKDINSVTKAHLSEPLEEWLTSGYWADLLTDIHRHTWIVFGS